MDQLPRIVALSRDVFFGMRMRTIVGQLGYELRLVQQEADLADPNAVLVIVDFNGAVDWETIAGLVAGPVPVLAFGAHTNTQGFAAARAVGVTRAISNGAFSKQLPELIERYRRH